MLYGLWNRLSKGNCESMEKSDWKSVGDRLKAIRLAKGFTIQAGYARLIGYEPPTYNMWERGNSPFPVEAALRVCTFTGATLDYIYRDDISSLPTSLMTLLSSNSDDDPPRNARASISAKRSSK